MVTRPAALRSATARFAPGRLVPAAVAVLATPILARLLTPAQFGRLAVLQSVALLAASVVFGWLEATVVRHFSGRARVTGERVSPLAGAWAAGAGALLAAGAVATAATGSWLALLTAAGAVGYACTLAATALARARQAAGAFTATAIAGACTRYIVGIPLVAAGGGVAVVLGAWAAGGVLALVLAGRLVDDVHGLRPSRPRREDVAFGGPLVVVQSGLLGLALGDRLLLSLYLTSAQIAPYALGYAIVDQAATLVFSVLMAARFPAMMRTYDEHGAEAARVQLDGAMRDFVLVAVPVLLGLALFGPEVARALGGPDYDAADFGFMPYVAAALLLHGVHQYLTVPLQQARRTRPWAAAVAVAAAVNVAANLVLIPRLGTDGAGLATLLGYAALVVTLAAAVPGSIRAPVRALALALPATAAAVAVAIGTQDLAWYVSAAAACGAYGLADLVVRRTEAIHVG